MKKRPLFHSQQFFHSHSAKVSRESHRLFSVSMTVNRDVQDKQDNDSNPDMIGILILSIDVGKSSMLLAAFHSLV